MVAASSSLRLLCLRNSRRITTLPTTLADGRALAHRSLSTSLAQQNIGGRQGGRGRSQDEDEDGTSYSTPRKVAESLSKRQRARLESLMSGPAESGVSSRGFIADEMREMASFDRTPMLDSHALETRPNRNSFWYDEDDPDTVTENVGDEMDEDDITSMAHAKLDEIRDMRQWTRIMAWEMPLLSSK